MSPRNDTRMDDLLAAARALLAARSDQMLTADEWEALERAVADIDAPAPGEGAETFSTDPGSGDLIRAVVPAAGRGNPYEHRCALAALEAVAHACDDAGQRGVTVEELKAATGLPFTQVAVALAFLKERGCIVPAHGRRHVPPQGTPGVHLDAMIEYHALRECPQPPQPPGT